MVPNLSRQIWLYVSRYNGKIEIPEVNAADGTTFSVFIEPAFFACGSADSVEQAWAIRDKEADMRDPGAYYFRLPNGVMTDEKRRDIVERVEKAYQSEENATGKLTGGNP